MKRFLYLLTVLSLPCLIYSQATISGIVLDTDENPLIGASILEVGTTNGAVTEIDGSFTLNTANSQGTIEISYIGYESQIIAFDGDILNVNLNLKEAFSRLDEVVVTGTRGKPRTILDSPVAIDNINTAELRNSGQKTVDQMLNYRVPSYNSTNQTISDATAHFDPSELRNLGPSRTLVLVNGKRKNQSALVYVNDTPGKGEVGTDMKSVPAAAIERIEVLRDGASAQYGSDAIAGVVNIVLKNRASGGELGLGGGITTEGDGLTYNADINKGLSIGNGGYLNLTGSFFYQEETDRSGVPGGDGLFGVIFGDDDILNGTHPWIQDNPDLGMTIGQPEQTNLSGFANLGVPYGTDGEFYGYIGYTYRKGTSFALYRAPYWITDDSGLLTPSGQAYNGFQPTFETDIGDLTATLGTKNKLGEWDSDFSVSLGSSTVDYTIGNTINVSLGASSPTNFDPGGYTFGNILANLDVSRTFDKLTLALGTEARRENFEVRAGQDESWVDGGAQSFPGLQPGNALEEDRTNIGVYASLDFDVSENTLLAAAIRYENYSDFGSNVSWKFAARQKFADGKGSLRASVNTGFRAPSLHQIYLSNVQTLISGGTVSNQGTFNNVSDVVKGLGIPALDAETSLNFTAGVTYKLSDKASISADYYNIELTDRVLFTGEIGFDGDDMTTNSVEQILIDNDVTSIKFFVNALDTRTQGFDLVLDYRGVPIGSNGTFGALLSINLNEIKILGTIEAPGTVGAEGYDIFSRKEQSRVTTARPDFKTLLGLNFKLGNFRASLNNTYFGEVTWQHADTPANDQTFGGKIITDLILGYQVTDKISIDVTANNLLDVYPDVINTNGDFVTDLGGRFLYPWEVNQFGFNGTIVRIGANVEF